MVANDTPVEISVTREGQGTGRSCISQGQLLAIWSTTWSTGAQASRAARWRSFRRNMGWVTTKSTSGSWWPLKVLRRDSGSSRRGAESAGDHTLRFPGQRAAGLSWASICRRSRVGEAVFPVLTKVRLDVRNPSRERRPGRRDDRRIFSADVLSPSSGCRRGFFYSREDRARFAGMDSALRENLSMGLSDGLDKQIIAGNQWPVDGNQP